MPDEVELETLQEHLKSSGLSAADGRKLKWKACQHAMRHHERPAFAIPYFDLAGKKIGFIRYRYLDTAFHSGPKYGQDRGSKPHVYFPSNFKWSTLAADAPVFVTEGEKKAAKACKEGIPCMALGGVNSFMDSSRGRGLIKDLEDFPWNDRIVYVVYDSDADQNRNVRSAMLQLARALTKYAHVGEVRAVSLSSDRDDLVEKVGLDDFLVANGVEAFERLVADAQPLTAAQHRLMQLSQKFCVVATPFEIRVCDPGDREFGLHWARRDWDALREWDTVAIPQANGRLKEEPLTKEWFKWHSRNTVARCDVLPEQPSGVVVNPDTDERVLNVYRGMGVIPKRGSIAPWRKLLKGLFHGERTKYIPWFEQWLAHQVQYPGTKLYQSVFLWGSGQGTGKSSIGVIMSKIFGESAMTITEDQLNGRFNSFLEGTLWAFADDLPVNDARSLRARIKSLVTNERLLCERKYAEPYMIENRCNFLFTANTAAAYPLDVGVNRRVFVIEAPTERPYPLEWYVGEFDKWVKGAGPAALLYHLLQVDLKGFTPTGDAPQTGDLRSAAETTTPHIEAWVQHVSSHFDEWCGDHKFEPCSMHYVAAKQLTALYNAENPDTVSTNRMARAMGDVLHRVDGQTRLVGGRLIQAYKLAPIPMPRGAARITAAVRRCFDLKGGAAKVADSG